MPGSLRNLLLASSVITLTGCSTLGAWNEKMPWSDSNEGSVDSAVSANAEQSDVVLEPVASLETVVFETDEPVEISDIFTPASEKMLANIEGAERPAIIKRNIYDTLTSNFSDFYQDYEEVERRVLIFPNDSLRLGDTNKQIIEQYVEMMDTSTDVLSVIGCSHGSTNIRNGNSLLALGRANRVKEAFLFSGVEHDAVLEEGCWAPQPFEGDLPDRGVVVTLKRRKSS